MRCQNYEKNNPIKHFEAKIIELDHLSLSEAYSNGSRIFFVFPSKYPDVKIVKQEAY